MKQQCKYSVVAIALATLLDVADSLHVLSILLLKLLTKYFKYADRSKIIFVTLVWRTYIRFF